MKEMLNDLPIVCPCFFVLFNFAFSEVYTPENLKEKEEFQKLQKQKIIIGLINEPFYNLSYPDVQSLNGTAMNFLKDYMQLDVVFKTVSYKDLESDLKNGTIDGVALIPKNHYYDKILDFSDSIFSE